MRTRLCAGLATLCLLAPAAHAEDRPLVWAVSELHGLINLERTDTESRLTGVVGRLQERLLSTLPETEVRPVLMSVPRMQRELQARDNVCTGIFLRTPERERFLVFSRPYLVIPTPQIVMSQAGWERLGRPERLPLLRVTGNDQLEGIRVTNRSYGRYLDADLDRATNLVTEVASSTSAIRMLAGNRADYLIEYPTVISQTLGAEAERLRFVTISDTSPFLEASISCTPSAQGQAFIDAVDRQLHSLITDPDYQALIRQLAPAQLQPQLMQAYTRLVLEAEP